MLLAPHQIKTLLDKHMISQEHAKRVLSVAVYNHYKRLHLRYSSDDIEIDKVTMLIGRQVRKTLLAKTLARILEIPYAITDATTVTEAGYVGEDVENILLQLLQAADYNLEKTQNYYILMKLIKLVVEQKTHLLRVMFPVKGFGKHF